MSVYSYSICRDFYINFKMIRTQKNMFKYLKPMLLQRRWASEVRRTCLYDFHVAQGGKIVEFAGFLLPVQYASEGLAASHRHVRNHCGVFDVSHMLQSEIRGKDRISFLESLCVADLQGLPENGATLTVFTNETGGIIDDLVVTRTSLGYLHIVSNAGRRDAVISLFAKNLSEWKAKGRDVSVQHAIPEEWALLAVQGPSAAAAVQPLINVDLTQLRFMSATLATVDGTPRCRVTRCGYTGEDGFEICVPASVSVAVSEQLLASNEQVHLAGLGARDSLRIEAGLCLYGNDITEDTLPIEAGLAWLVGKRRRETADFPGAKQILEQLRQGPSRRRVGLRSQGPPARSGAIIMDLEGNKVGQVTSGCPSPTLGGNTAMGYIDTNLSKVGTKVKLLVRNSSIDAEVSKMPFIKTNYYIPDKKK